MTDVASASDAAAAAVVAERRIVKFRQAAFVYLHVAILYEAAAYAMWRRGLLPRTRVGPAGLWLVIGGLVAVGIFLLLYRWRNVWAARAVWALHGLRLPALVQGAFFAEASTRLAPPSFYLTAMVVVMINLWMLARAAWDL